MAAKNGNGKVKLQDFVKNQLEEAKNRFTAFEEEAEGAFKQLVAKGKAQRNLVQKDLEGLMDKLNAGELFDSKKVKQLSKRANQAGTEVKKRLDGIQAKVVEATGVATRSQVKEINRELTKLSKKLDALISKAPRPDARA
jgi:hypothetical protein